MSDEDFTERGRLLFAGACEFVFASAHAGDLPPLGPPEIAFAGRSNVGKSSLLNALTGRKALARVSHTPGRTQQLNFFAIRGGEPGQERLRLVDMPGYGYAAAGKDKIADWSVLIQDFLRGRVSLVRVFVLVDSRRGITSLDGEMFDLLDRAAVSYQVVLTKRDAVKPAAHGALIEATLAALAKRPAAFPEIVFTSAERGEGVVELRAAVARLVFERSG